MKRLRIYLDTSVIGGCLDQEFADESCALIDLARRGETELIVSDLLAQEIMYAPEAVRAILTSLSDEHMIQVVRTPETVRLRDCYLLAGVVGQASESDAHHVAIASVYSADVIVSWNFKHIVHLDKIRGFNSVNIREGYSPIEIRTPREVI